jgi:hypothetical protein
MEKNIGPGPPPLKVRNAAQALNTALGYLAGQKAPGIPDADSEWQEKTLYEAGIADYAVTGKLYTSGDWSIEINQGVAPLSKTVFRVTVFDPRTRFYWKGSVKAGGEVMEECPFRLLSGEESRKTEDGLTRKVRVPPPAPGGYGH